MDVSLSRRQGILTPAAILPSDGSQTANHANSTSPVSAALSNTVPGYTTLGGRYQFAAVAGAATDFALFGFQVPAGFRFLMTGITITSIVAVTAVVTTTIFDWGLAINSSAASLATAGIVRIPLGLQSFLAAAAVGAVAPDIVRRFDPEIPVESGRFVHVILQIPNGAATATLVFRGDVQIQGYFEKAG